MRECFITPGRACTVAATGALSGVLCESCVSRISTLERLCPEQIVTHIDPEKSTGAALVDRWGRLHPLAPRTVIGRDLESANISVADACVSRQHAELEQDPVGAWSVRDLGSSNGSMLNETPLTGRMGVRSGDVLMVASVGFFFVDGAGAGAAVRSTRTSPMRTLDPYATARAVRRSNGTMNEAEAAAGDAPPPAEEEEGLPIVELTLCEPSGGGGGIVAVHGRAIQLTPTQFELLQLLCNRMREETDKPPLVRGFVRSAELIGSLSWDTVHPDENHLKQLVRRLRRTLERANLGDLIESRHRFGYRLRVLPR